MENDRDALSINPKDAHILIVDDEAINVRLLEKTLSNKGYNNVTSTQDPTQVVALYQQQQPDLILLDINMPILDGYGVLNQLNEATHNNLPSILVLTAQQTQTYRQRALDNGARDYVTKPFDITELLSRVQNLLDVEMSKKYMRYQNEILEHKVAERTHELLLAKNEALRSNQAKTNFLANMSHELRTPLNGIIGFSQIMETQLFGPLGSKHYEDYACDISMAGRNLLNIIDDILDITRLESGDINFTPTPVDLTQAIDESIQKVCKMATIANITITKNVDPTIPHIMADIERLKQIFHNLLSNSIKFTPDGAITISVHQTHKDLVIEVQDTGTGILHKDIAHVLQPFGQSQENSHIARDGVGLGLALSKAFTEMHGGIFELQSDLGIGTTVSLYFPLTILVSQE